VLEERLMRTVDELVVRADADRMFAAAADVERWPERLPHYRRVRFSARRPDGGVVEMAAVRPFGPLAWPVWWESEMWIDAARREVRYRHVRGITAGMDVTWSVVPRGREESDVRIVHTWAGPAWPLIRVPAADWVIGPVFVHGIASRTLAGLARSVETARG
jgi:ribosome-associated toxin RatA of RatAB toxin-antitoxin module